MFPLMTIPWRLATMTAFGRENWQKTITRWNRRTNVQTNEATS